MMGADALSANAKEMEAAAKKRDKGYIREHHEALLEQYRQVVQCIGDVLGFGTNDDMQAASEDTTEMTKEELLLRLAELKEGLDTFEADKAETLIEKMGKAVYQGTPVSELLHEVGQDVDDFEFASASEKVKAVIKKVEGGEAG